MNMSLHGVTLYDISDLASVFLFYTLALVQILSLRIKFCSRQAISIVILSLTLSLIACANIIGIICQLILIICILTRKKRVQERTYEYPLWFRVGVIYVSTVLFFAGFYFFFFDLFITKVFVTGAVALSWTCMFLLPPFVLSCLSVIETDLGKTKLFVSSNNIQQSQIAKGG